MTLVARDEAGQEGRSEPVEVVLPARHFNDPLARAVVEQRAKLAMDANAADRVADALDALTLAPDRRHRRRRRTISRCAAPITGSSRRATTTTLRGVVDYLWSIALGIEDGDLSLAAQELRAAQEALRQALENGASDEEIARLTAGAARGDAEIPAGARRRGAAQSAAWPTCRPMPTRRCCARRTSQRMLDQIENLAKTGARDAARQLLSELQNMLENLQAGRPMMGDQQSAEQMMQSLERARRHDPPAAGADGQDATAPTAAWTRRAATRSR